MNMTKNLKNLRSIEFVDTAAKRALINGMTMSYAERYLDMKRSALIIVSNQLTSDDYKELQGSSPADCICKEAQEIVKDCFKEGKSAKWIAQQTKLPSNVVRAIEKDAGIIHASTTKVETPKPEVPAEITSTETKEENSSKKAKRSYRKYDDETGEMLYQEAMSDKTRKEIASEYGISQSSIKHVLDSYRKRHNIKAYPFPAHCGNVSKNGSLTESQVIEISNLIMQGYSNIKISERLDIPTYKIADIRGKRTYRSLTKDYNFILNENCGSVFSTKSISPATVKAVVEMLLAGKPNIEIAKELNINPSTVCNIRNKKNFKSFTKGLEFPDPMSCEVIRKPNDHTSHVEHGPYVHHNDDDGNDVPYELVTEIVEVPTDDGKTYVDVIPTEGESTAVVETTECEVSKDNTDTEEDDDVVNDYLNGDYDEVPEEPSSSITEETREEAIKVIDVKNNQHQYFGNIAKAFAADRAAVISTRDDQIVSYIVANTIEECMIRMISLLTPEEIAGTNLYVSGKYNDMHAIVNMAKIIKVNNLIIK